MRDLIRRWRCSVHARRRRALLADSPLLIPWGRDELVEFVDAAYTIIRERLTPEGMDDPGRLPIQLPEADPEFGAASIAELAAMFYLAGVRDSVADYVKTHGGAR